MAAPDDAGCAAVLSEHGEGGRVVEDEDVAVVAQTARRLCDPLEVLAPGRGCDGGLGALHSVVEVAGDVAERGGAIEDAPLDVHPGVRHQRQETAQQLRASVPGRGRRHVDHTELPERVRKRADALDRLPSCELAVVAERAAAGLDPLQAAPHRTGSLNAKPVTDAHAVLAY